MQPNFYVYLYEVETNRERKTMSNTKLNANSGFMAEVIADSITEHGNRLTTFVICFPRMILAELNTHRMFSRSSASSRAIPFKRMLKMVNENPFIPMRFQKDHSGMQGTEYFTGDDHDRKVQCWLKWRDANAAHALAFHNEGVTKQICNRGLETFMWHTVIVSATDYENFFALRVHEAAEIHMQHIAGMMLDAYNDSDPVKMQEGEWHLPFGDNIDEPRFISAIQNAIPHDTVIDEELKTRYRIKVAVARCARVSYLNFEGKDDYTADFNLCDILSTSGHMSPFEMVAQAGGNMRCGNFKGWIQYRKQFENENRTDSRVHTKDCLRMRG